MTEHARKLPSAPANDAPPPRAPVPPEARPFILALARLALANALRRPPGGE